MKILKNNIPFLLALMPQVLFADYTLVLIATIVIGCLGGWLIEGKRIFPKMILWQLLFFGLLFLSQRHNIAYLDQVLGNLELPSIILPVLFIVFNALNIAILFFFGYKLQRLVFHRTPLQAHEGS